MFYGIVGCLLRAGGHEVLPYNILWPISSLRWCYRGLRFVFYGIVGCMHGCGRTRGPPLQYRQYSNVNVIIMHWYTNKRMHCSCILALLLFSCLFAEGFCYCFCFVQVFGFWVPVAFYFRFNNFKS
ncbi:MAG: hypothetical protein K0R06_1865 [Clostridium sp.]|nr:hypothetical protein [Clostridium sp.]